MLKKLIVLVFCLFLSLTGYAQETPAAPEVTEAPVVTEAPAVTETPAPPADDFKTVNGLVYHKSMLNAAPSVDYLKIPFGRETANVGGQDQDSETDAASYGVPWAFRMTDDGNVWVLDTLNKSLKLFKKDGTVERAVSIASFGQMVIDFAVAPDGRMAFLNNVEGFIYLVDAKGEKVNEIEGFGGARAIEFGSTGELLVSHPVMQSVLRFSENGELKEQLVGDQSLSLFPNAAGQLYGLEIRDLAADLYLRTVASPAATLVLATFPYEEGYPGVTYAGGEILGLDAAGTVYFCLVACHEMGQIYRERLYKCAPDGKVLSQLDVLTVPHLAPDLPRKRVVCPDGRVMSFYPDETNYTLCTYTLP